MEEEYDKPDGHEEGSSDFTHVKGPRDVWHIV